MDTSRYAILPFEHGAGVPTTVNERQLLQDALERWGGVEVVDPFQVRDALARRGDDLDTRTAQIVAREVGAGRYVRGEVSAIGDSLRIRAVLYGTGTGTVLKDVSVRTGPSLAGTDSIFIGLGDSLLFREGGPGGRREGPIATRSAPARQSFAAGQSAIEDWRLDDADSAFSAAARYDPDYSQAHLWLAQVRFWDGAPPATWGSAAERAAAGRAHLSTRDQLVSDALDALGRDETAKACAALDRLTRVEPFDFTSWYSLSRCLFADSAVVRDSRSPSGWRFRSSYHHALTAYERALRLRPSIHRSLRADGYQAVRHQLMTSGNDLRSGRALAPDTTTFATYPSWLGDSLSFVPYPASQVTAGDPQTVPPTLAEAVRHQRGAFRDIALTWAAAYPRSADAIEALALSLEMLGDRSAIDTVRRARMLARDASDQVRIATTEIWMRVKFALPGDTAGLHAARRLADSLLDRSWAALAADARLLAGLAALTGRGHIAARLSAEPAVAASWGVPPSLVPAAPRLLAYAALGGPADTLRILESERRGRIGRLPPQAQLTLRIQWLGFPATPGVPRPADAFRHGVWLAGRTTCWTPRQRLSGRTLWQFAHPGGST